MCKTSNDHSEQSGVRTYSERYSNLEPVSSAELCRPSVELKEEKDGSGVGERERGKRKSGHTDAK